MTTAKLLATNSDTKLWEILKPHAHTTGLGDAGTEARLRRLDATAEPEPEHGGDV